MAKRKSPSGQRLKEIRSGLSKLKAQGLWSGDARSAKGGWRQIALLKQYQDVVKGKAKSVKIGKDAKDFDKSYRARKGRVVVKPSAGENVRYNPKTKQLSSTIEEYGIKYRRIFVKDRPADPSQLPYKPRKGKKWLYRLPHNPLLDRQGMIDLLSRYKGKKGVMDAMMIYEVNASDFPDDLPEDE